MSPLEGLDHESGDRKRILPHEVPFARLLGAEGEERASKTGGAPSWQDDDLFGAVSVEVCCHHVVDRSAAVFADCLSDGQRGSKGPVRARVVVDVECKPMRTDDDVVLVALRERVLEYEIGADVGRPDRRGQRLRQPCRTWDIGVASWPR